MRTKTLLLTAALSVAGIASSMAQAVYSVNAVGYVNTDLVPGFNLISNPLDNKTGNTVANLFGTGIQGAIPAGTTVYTFANGNFRIAQYDDLDGAFGGEAASDVVAPGSGVFVRNPSSSNLRVTFVGEVPQGNLSTPLPVGYSIKASQVPQAGVASAMGLQGAVGDSITLWSEASQSFNFTSQFDELDNDWSPALPVLAVGDAFMYRNGGTTARAWNRTFSVNQ
jgi:hypothetical protein